MRRLGRGRIMLEGVLIGGRMGGKGREGGELMHRKEGLSIYIKTGMNEPLVKLRRGSSGCHMNTRLLLFFAVHFSTNSPHCI